MAVARVTKITASSTQSFQQAVDDGLTRAASSLRGITGLEVVSQKARSPSIAPRSRSPSSWTRSLFTPEEPVASGLGPVAEGCHLRVAA
jgi:hypothetical protein